MSIIYKITNLTNGMVYIGRSNKTLEEAWTTHRYEGHQKNPVRLIGQVIKEFGIDNFSHETIEECDASELRARHKYWMERYESQEKGYNKRHEGGTPVSHDDVVEMHNKGMTAAEIAKELQCDERTVVSHIKAETPEKPIKEITQRTGKPHSRDNIMRLWNEGLNHLEIAEQLQRRVEYVHSILRQNGVTIEELYARRGLPIPDSCRKYEYAQVDVHEMLLETPDRAKVIANKHEISTSALRDACAGPSKKARGKMFRRLNEDGEMMPRIHEPVGNTIATRATCVAHPSLTQDFPSITAAAVALVGTKDVSVMQKIRAAAKNGTEYKGMYWTTQPTENRRRPIYAFSVEDYNIQHVFLTQTEAAIALHVHQNIVSRHLNYPQKYRSAGGFICTWDENFSQQDWVNAVQYARPVNGRSGESQVKEKRIYLTNIDVYEVTYCPTLLDAMEKTQGSVALIQKCLNGKALHTKNYFVTDYPLPMSEWKARVQTLNPICKPVYGVHTITKEVITATSIQNAAKKVGRSRKSISSALCGLTKLAAGYQWYYGVPKTA